MKADDKAKTPRGLVPYSVAREAPPGSIWSLDGSGYVPLNHPYGARYCVDYLVASYVLSDGFQFRQDTDFGRIADVNQWLELDKLQGVQALVMMLRVSADVFDALGLGVDVTGAATGQAFHTIVDESGRVLRRFRSPADWRDFADELDDQFLVPHGVQTEVPPPEVGAAPAAPLIIWGTEITLQGILLVAGAMGVIGLAAVVAWSIGRVTSYLSAQISVLQGRTACFDRWAAEYDETGDPRARELMAACHEQSTALANRIGLGFNGGGALVTAGLGLLAFYYFRNQPKKG